MTDEKPEMPQPDPWECRESFASKFHMDLEAWVTENSESFHWRIFFIDARALKEDLYMVC